MLPITIIEARDIPDAWYQCINAVQEIGFEYVIQHGSFIGEQRLEFDFIVIQIMYPYVEPYFEMVNMRIPSHLNIPNPTAEGYIEQYVPYLMTGEKEDDEDYTYGQRLIYNIDQVDHFIKLLKSTPNTNQAIMQIGQPMDCLLEDPPCLRHIDMRIRDKKLVFYPYFRSWDLWSGFPANLAAIAILQKYMADQIEIESGPIIASSKGLHFYGYVKEIAKLRTGRK